MIFKPAILCALLSCTLALDDSKSARIVDYQLEHTPSGHYYFRFENSDGTTREEEGNLLDQTVPDSPVIVKGSYSYTDDTGKVYTVRYVADENGFHPEGDHIQVPLYVVNPGTLKIAPRPVTTIPFLPTTPRPQFQGGYSTTGRPEVSTTPTRIQIPVDGTTPKPVEFGDLDRKLQGSLVNLLANGNPRGFSVGAI